MSTKHRKLLNVLLPIAAGIVTSACAIVGGNDKPEPMIIKEQGSFAVGGTVITAPGTYDAMKQQSPDGQTFHGDHAYVFYQVPVNARKFPLVLWHGFGQFSKTWETTPDGREGFQNIYLRRGFGVYEIDQPRRRLTDLPIEPARSFSSAPGIRHLQSRTTPAKRGNRPNAMNHRSRKFPQTIGTKPGPASACVLILRAPLSGRPRAR
jgi:hypothetical protein